MTGPIFIVGAGRSGTSVLLSTLRKTLGWPCHGEGHVFPLLAALHACADGFFKHHKVKARHKDHLLTHVEPSAFKAKLAEPIRQVYAENYGASAFIDKTPGWHGVMAIPLMQDAFPGMRVIFAKRRGLEVVRSGVRKFRHVDFKDNCRMWRDCMATWGARRAELNCDYVEIDQFHLAHAPDRVVADLDALLQLSAEQRERMLGFFRKDRPQSSGPLNEMPRAIEDFDWDEQQVATFREICGGVMEEYGYSETESYFANSDPEAASG